MNIVKKKILLVALVAKFSLSVLFAEEISFETITDALNYNGDKNAITKLIITGTITGNSYSASSEWRAFRWLDYTFPNIESVEILTDQDIPGSAMIGLFFDDHGYKIVPPGADWLKSFSAPNVKHIGDNAFRACENLISVNLPSLTSIGQWVFSGCKNLTTEDFPFVTIIRTGAFTSCENLTTVNFPLLTTISGAAFYGCFSLTSVNFPAVTRIYGSAFNSCYNLKSVNFPMVQEIYLYAFRDCIGLTSVILGTGFDEPTTITFGENIFYSVETENIDLCLSEFVLPPPDFDNNSWNGYTWKSINDAEICNISVRENLIATHLTISPNPTNGTTTLSLDLQSAGNLTITLNDLLGAELFELHNAFEDTGTFTKTFFLETLPKGTYFLKISHNGNTKIEKVIRN